MNRLSKLSNLILTAFAVAAVAVSGAMAATASQLASTINSFAHGGTGMLTAAAEGDVVTVGGTVSGVTASLSLNINQGVTVKWEANYSGNNGIGLIRLTGDGAFEVSGGTVSATTGTAIYADGANSAVTVSGGTVSNSGTTETTPAIYMSNTAPTAANLVTVSGTGKVQNTVTTSANSIAIRTVGSVEVKDNAEVSASTGTAIYAEGASSTVTVSGGTVSATSGRSSRAIYATGASSTVTVSGGTVSATSGTAIYADGASSTVTVSGGTVSAENGAAIDATGESSTVGVSGGTVSAMTGRAISASGASSAVTVSGGTVSAPSGRAIYADGASSAVTVSGGTVSAPTGRAIHATGESSTVTVSGGTVSSGSSAETAPAIYMSNTSPTAANLVTVSGTGKVRNDVNNSYACAIRTAGRVLVEGGAEVSATYGRAIYADGASSAVTVSGGTVSATTGRAIYADGASSAVTVSGGTVSNSGRTKTEPAIYMSNTSPTAANLVTVSGTGKVRNDGNNANAFAIRTAGRVLVEGGAEVSATIGTAIYATGASSIVTVSGGTVSNSGTTDTTAAIYMSNTSPTAANLVTVSGTGKVRNDGNNANARAIRTAGRVLVEGGAEVSATSGTAIHTTGANSVVFVNGAAAVSGTVKYNSTGANAVNIEYAGIGAGAIYMVGSDWDLTVTPAAASAVWAIDNEKTGIRYTRSTNTGFLEVSGVALPQLQDVSSYINFTSGSFAYSGIEQTYEAAAEGFTVGEGPQLTHIYTVGSNPTGNESFGANGKPVNAGNYKVTARYIDSENGGFQSAAFTIATKNITGAAVAVGGTYTYTGAAQTPAAADVSVTLTGFTPTYTSAVTSNTDAGTATVTVTGTDNFSGTATGTFTIAPKSITGATVAVSGTYTYTGAAQTPAATNVSVTLTGFTPTYSIAATGNTDAGTATVTVTGTDNFSGTETGTFTIGKADYDMSGITFANNTVTQNGAAQSILIGGTLPSGVTVTYSGNGQTAIGEHTVTATFAVSDATNYNVPAAKTATLTITAQVSVLAQDRVIPAAKPSEEATVIAPVTALSGEFTAGPNPILKQYGIVNFYRQGKRIANSELRIYDATGNVISKVKISDNVIGSQSRRIVGKWDLTDRKGRQVSEGAYLVKGVVKTSDGKSEKVSVILGVR